MNALLTSGLEYHRAIWMLSFVFPIVRATQYNLNGKKG